MSTILAVFDISDAPWHVLNFGCKLAKTHEAQLYGIFLSEPTGDTEFKYGFPNDLSMTKDEITDDIIDKENTSLINDNVKLFRDECTHAGIQHRVDSMFSLKEAIKASDSASLILADHLAEFAEELIKNAKVPVCLLSGEPDPRSVHFPDDYNKDTLFSEFPELRNAN